MQPRENNQRPISRQSYSGYRSPSIDGVSSVPPRRVETSPQPVSLPPQPDTPRPNQVPSQQPNLAPVAPVWEPEPVKPLIPTQQPEQASIPTPQPAQYQPAPPESPQPKPEVPKKPRRKIPYKKVFKILGGIAGTLVIGGAIFYYASPFIITPDPATLLKDGLTNNMSLKSIQVDNSVGQDTEQTIVDLKNLKDPIVSGTFSITKPGGVFGLSTYGTKSDTFFSYTKLPDSVNPGTSKQVLNQWIQMRKAGKLDADTSHSLASISDPKSRIFGPMLYGNFDEQTSKQLVDFLISHNVYKVQTENPAKRKVNNQKAIVLPVALDVGYLKVAMQSAALSLGYAPNDIADAVRAMDYYKGAKGDLYITQRSHKIIKFVLKTSDGKSVDINYSNFDKATTTAQPSSAFEWSKFAPVQWQIEAQSYTKVSPDKIDEKRKNDLGMLHANLSSYAAQRGYYPSLAAMNDLSWLTNIALGAPEMQRDPLAINLSLAPAPALNNHAYIPSPANCNNITVPCMHYQLVSVLSDGKQYIVQDP